MVPPVIRPQTDADIDAVSAVFRAARSRYALSADELRRQVRDLRAASTDPFYAAAVATLEGEVLGAGTVWQSPGRKVAGLYEVEVVVAPGQEGRGLGRRLADWARATLPTDAHTVKAGAYADHPRGLAFAAAQGLRERDRTFGGVQDPAAVVLPDAPLPDGWRVATFRAWAAERGEEAAWRDYHGVVEETRADVPAGEPTQPESWPAFRDRRAPLLARDADGALLAVDAAGRVQGVTELFPSDEAGVATVLLTGVRRPARGRGVALALKVAATRHARERGYRAVRTFNAASNAPMLAVNERLGFRREREWVELYSA